jgi:hypothetical protein
MCLVTILNSNKQRKVSVIPTSLPKKWPGGSNSIRNEKTVKITHLKTSFPSKERN